MLLPASDRASSARWRVPARVGHHARIDYEGEAVKTRVWLASVGVVVALSGCSGGETSTDGDAGETVVSEPTPEGLPTFKRSETATYLQSYSDDTPPTTWSLKLGEVKCGETTIPDVLSNPEYLDSGGTKGSEYLDLVAKPGQVFCRVFVSASNVGDAPGTPWQPGNLWVGGKQYAPVDDSGTIVAMVLARGLPGSGSANPGGVSELVQVYEVPVGSVPDGVSYPESGLVGGSALVLSTEE